MSPDTDPFWVINIGDVATVVGMILTICGITFSIYVSIKARGSAEAAEIAANSMKEKIFSIDAINDLNRCISLFEDAKRTISAGHFQISAERTSEIRRMIAPIIHSDAIPFSEMVNARLLELQGQIVSMNETLHTNIDKQMSKANKGALYQIIDTQIESLSIALNELKQGVEVKHGG